MLKPNTKSVYDLLAGKEQYVVPTYQRGYDWKSDRQIADFWDDIESCLKAKDRSELFLGTTIIRATGKGEDGYQQSEIIDGQQRITTIFIFLIVMRSYADNALKSDEVDANVIHDMIALKKSLLKNSKQVDRFLPSDKIQTVFHHIARRDWNQEFPDKIEVDGVKKGVIYGVRKVKPVYEKLYEYLETYCRGNVERFEAVLNQLTDKTFVISIEIEDEEEAFEIFERTNARGKSLEISDLLKNYLFSKDKKMSSSAEDIWKEITEKAGNSMLRMLKYFWISRRGHVSNRDLYTFIRKYADSLDIDSFCEELLEFAGFYEAYHSDDFNKFQAWLKQQNILPKDTAYELEVVRVRNTFRLFKITQVIPIVYSCTNAIKNSDKPVKKSAKTFIKLMRHLEEYHLVNTKLTTSIGNEVEKLYAKYSNDIFHSQDFSIQANTLKQALTKKRVSDESIIAGLKSLSYDEDDKHIIRYIFDFIENYKIDHGARLPIFDYADVLSGNKGLYNIDHIMSQSEAKSKTDVIDKETLHEVGNLIVIPRQMNSVFQASSYDDRKDLILNWGKYDKKISNPPKFVSEFYSKDLPKDEWDKKAIKTRSSELGERLLEAIKNRYRYD